MWVGQEAWAILESIYSVKRHLSSYPDRSRDGNGNRTASVRTETVRFSHELGATCCQTELGRTHSHSRRAHSDTARHEVHAPGGRRNTSRDVHFPKSVINRLSAKQEKALKNQRGVRLRVHVRDVKKILTTEDVELLERVYTTKDVHFRTFKLQASVFGLHLDAEITPGSFEIWPISWRL